MNKGLMSMHAGLEEEIHAVPPLPDDLDNNIQGTNGEASLVFKPLS
tara:strand:- start:81 stop:218 length:138 start_codon:yes stop_codon:yes gene_type:complete